jgi:hypothetical protein
VHFLLFSLRGKLFRDPLSSPTPIPIPTLFGTSSEFAREKELEGNALERASNPNPACVSSGEVLLFSPLPDWRSFVLKVRGGGGGETMKYGSDLLLTLESCLLLERGSLQLDIYRKFRPGGSFK